MANTLLAFLYISLTYLVFYIMTKVYQRFTFPLVLPIITSTIILIGLLLMTHTSYQTYMIGGKWINQLLGPAVVALAYPLYQNRQMLIRHAVPILTGVLFGTLMAIFSVFSMALLSGIKGTLLFSVLPKSVTTPIALAVSKELGGVPSLTVTFVMIAGIFGASTGPYILRLFRVRDPIARGIGYGSASHAIGTSKALEESAMVGAISSIAMILCALITSILLPLLHRLLT